MNTYKHSVSNRIRVALTFAALTALLGIVHAQTNTDGAISGKLGSGGGTVVATNPATGFTRSVTVGNDGTFRAGSLPPGNYTVTYTSPSGAKTTSNVAVSIGTTSNVVFDSDTVALDVFQVQETRINPVDFQRTEATTVFSTELLSVVPVTQTASAVALLAPGTVQGDSDFGDRGPLVSFGGASVAENAYYINGLNVANFRNGLDPSTVPWEFYDQFEVKTGAYSAEFGRSTGGVINATTKSGGNRFAGGISAYYTPAALKGKSPDIYYTNADGERQVHSHNSSDRSSERTINAYASGPLIKNKLFFYGLYTLRRDEERNIVTQGTDADHMLDDGPFWGAKIDFVPFEGHRFEYTAFSDKSDKVTTTYAFDVPTLSEIGTEPKSVLTKNLGGKSQIVRYTGNLTEDFTLSALYGKNEANRTAKSSVDDEPGIWDTRTGHSEWVSGNPDLIVSDAYDEREAMRLDLEYTFNALGSHRLRGGYDAEDNFSYSNDYYTGGYYWRYYTVEPGATVNGVPVPAGVTEVVRERLYNNGGGFKVKSSAYYLEDNWTLMDERLLLRLGVRNETFENLSATDDTFIKIDEQYAPRIGISYDLFGNKKTKVFANFGRYHLPIASNTNIRLAGSETFTEQYFILNGINADYSPIKGATQGEETVYSDGSVKDRQRIVAENIEPMYQDEWVVGIQQKLSSKWSAGIRGVYRDLKSSIDDVIVDQALASYAQRNGYAAPELEAHEYVLANPGKDITYYYDIDGDGTNDRIELTAEDIGFPEAKRKYVSAEVFVERMWDNKWQAQFSYTWSQSYGNTEGWVKSDNSQDDAGITSNFDAPGLVAGTNGFLPNDRRHQFKVFGSYALTKNLQLGFNTRLVSGRPINRFGVYPISLDEVANGYGSEAFWIGGDPANGEPGTPTSRGDNGRTPWNFNVDLSLVYKPTWGRDKVTLGVDVFNVFNSHQATDVRETYEEDTGGRDYRYGLPTYFQDPFAVRFSTRVEFINEVM